MSDQMLARIRKLLAKAEDPACTVAEAAAFTVKATELIAKYGVDRALLAAADPTVDPVGDRMVEVEPPYALDKAGLLAGVAIALRCRLVRRRLGAAFHMHLFGCVSDLDRVEVLYTSLLVQAAHGMAATEVPDRDHPAAFRRSWLAGFTAAVHARLRAAEAAAQHATDGDSMALVLVDRRDRVERRMADVYPRVRTAGRRRLVGGGLEQGYAAGRSADLAGPRLRAAAG